MTIKGDGITNARPVTFSSAKPMASQKEDELGDFISARGAGDSHLWRTSFTSLSLRSE